MKAPDLDPRLEERLADAERRFAGVEEALSSPEVLSSPDKLRDLGQERAYLEPIVQTGRELRGVLIEFEGAIELVEESDDPEMKDMLYSVYVHTLSGRHWAADCVDRTLCESVARLLALRYHAPIDGLPDE